ncbi:MAG: hypothetical protein ACREVG_13095 [Burkholderiales bacterium]
MNAKRLSLILFLTLAAGGVATAAIKHGDIGSTKAAAPQEAVGEIPRIVVTASRHQADAEGCEQPIPRIVVVGRRADLGKVAAAK